MRTQPSAAHHTHTLFNTLFKIIHYYVFYVWWRCKYSFFTFIRLFYTPPPAPPAPKKIYYENKYLLEVRKRKQQELLQEKKVLDGSYDTKFVMESTPVGNVLMKYDRERESFVYYCDMGSSKITHFYLEVAARKYVKMFDCCFLYNDYFDTIRQLNEDKGEVGVGVKEDVDVVEVHRKKSSLIPMPSGGMPKKSETMVAKLSREKNRQNEVTDEPC
jgi:hypothetical protein